jgi:ankyrin repeat protein
MHVLTPIGTQDGDAALALASENGHVEVVKVLLAAKAAINAKNHVRLHVLPINVVCCESTAELAFCDWTRIESDTN